MNTIWFLSKERNLLICGFNRIKKEDNTTELWVKEVDGGSRKIATGQEAINLEQALLDIIWGGFPSIITIKKQKKKSNLLLFIRGDIMNICEAIVVCVGIICITIINLMK